MQVIEPAQIIQAQAFAYWRLTTYEHDVIVNALRREQRQGRAKQRRDGSQVSPEASERAGVMQRAALDLQCDQPSGIEYFKLNIRDALQASIDRE